MPTKLEAAVYGVLDAKGGEEWKARLRAHVKGAIVQRARNLLGSPPLALPAEWDSLDVAEYRAAAAGTVEDCAEGVSRALSLDGTLFLKYKAAVEGAGLDLNKTKLVNALRPKLAQLIEPGTVRAYAEAVTPDSIWPALANLIAVEIHAAGNGYTPQSEADCLHWSLLAAFFQATKIPDATRLGRTLSTSLTRGRFNVRGSLLRNVERTSADGIVDPAMTYVPYARVVLAPAHLAASQLLKSVAEQSQQIPAGQGFANITLGRHTRAGAPVISPANARLGITPNMVLASRLFRYQQYEYSALSLSTIASTEFLLRCAAEANPGLSLDARFAAQTEIAEALPLTDALKAELRDLFSSTGPNFRNRSLHGGFLEIESRRTEITMYSGFAAGIGVPTLNLDGDPYIPKNAAAVALKAMGGLDSELAPLALVHPGTKNWTTHFGLDTADLAFAAGIDQPMLKLLSIDQERRRIADFVREAFPCLSIPVQLGLIGWSTPKRGASSIQLFALLAVMFEPMMRLVAHGAGFPILRRGGKAGVRFTRYRMLDDQGFLADDFLDWIGDGLPASERANARRTIRTGVRCRDAFAHGAVTIFDESTRKAYGALMAKSLHLLITAAINRGI